MNWHLNMRTYKHYIIYKITNLVNGKIYIGKHKCNRLDDNYFGSGKNLKQAIEKYGRENFIFHLEIDLKNQEEMDLLEEMVVNKDFLARSDVYNISRGGKNPCMYGKDNPFYGKDFSEDHKRKLSLKFKGCHISEEHKRHISEGLLNLYSEHPEIKQKFATRKNKKQCKNKKTGEIKFFNPNNIPDNFEIYKTPQIYHKMTEEQKIEYKKKCSEKCKKSKWYTDGVKETFCLPENKPEGFHLGRLATTNVGRKISDETKNKMRIKKIGKTPGNKGKFFITNGKENIYISKDEPIPTGWWRGLSKKKK